jgi:hypothetical protein
VRRDAEPDVTLRDPGGMPIRKLVRSERGFVFLLVQWTTRAKLTMRAITFAEDCGVCYRVDSMEFLPQTA